MPERDVRERDILVAPNEYAYVQDLTKGDIGLYVGPTKISLSNTERLVEYYEDRFITVRSEEGNMGVNPFIVASSSQYIILENPPKDPNAKPAKGANYSIELLIGRKVVVSGPVAFPLWPGQKAEVINGHELREDQYLVVRVYDKTVDDDSPIGTERIIKGSDVSFYIPKTGLEVVPDENDNYVRRAVTLLDGEYCILLAPNGKKKYFHGPAVVFPEPMEEFVQHDGNRIFRAHHLKKNMGLYIRVVKDFNANDNELVPAGAYTAGQELFLKDREGFFFPSENLAVIGEVHAIPIAEKEGIYVREIETGRISTEIGPKNYLPDPTKVEVVARILDSEIARLYGLGDRSANAVQLRAALSSARERLVQKPPIERVDTSYVSQLGGAASINKAISIYIPPSFAVLVTARNKREIVKGPQTRILDYDEDLEILKLSTGKPKTDENLLSTCFLQTEGNKVSDIVRVKTSDHVELEVLLSYRVSFAAKSEEESEKWFNVKNYVGLLCDHLGSIVRGAVRTTSIDIFHSNSTEVIRTAILGEKRVEGKRTGRLFDENNMWVYDVEVLDVKILDADVNKLLSDAQRTAIVFEVTSKQEQMRLNSERLKEEVNRLIYESQVTTVEKAIDLENARKNFALAKTQVTIETDRLETVGKAKNQAEALEISTSAQIAASSKQAEVDLKLLSAKVTAFKEQMAAIEPELVTTLKVLGDKQMATELAKNLSPLAILGGESVAEVVERLLKGLPIGLSLTDGVAKALPQLQPSSEKEKKK
ncbi:MAG: hypothetical protein AB1489_25250 [Acidobacteriota bacterium]